MKTRIIASVAGVLCLTTALPVILAAPASAHPLGNFTRNTYAGFTISPTMVTADHVLDLAEIPTYQEQEGMDADGNGTVTQEEADAWGRERCTVNATQIIASTNMGPVVWELEESKISFPAGEGGLPTTRLECLYSAETSGASQFKADVLIEQGRVGWHEVTAVGDGVTLTADVPAVSASKRLTVYPSYAAAFETSSVEASWTIDPAGQASPGPTVSEGPGDPLAPFVPFGLDSAATSFTNLVSEQNITFLFILFAIAVSMFLGGLHALAPGHGKTMMAASLLSTEGRRRDAVVLGASVTVAHTAGVVLLAFALSLSSSLAAESAYPWLGLIGGGIAVFVGVSLFRQVHRGMQPHTHGGHTHTHGGLEHTHDESSVEEHTHEGHEHPHPHEHDNEHDHPHDHPHPREHPHPHEHDDEDAHSAPIVSPVTPVTPTPTATSSRPGIRRLIALGLAGGMVPAPSAVIVLLAGFALGRSWFAFLLVIAYGLGMAITLCVTGLVLVHAGRLSQRVAAGKGIHRHVKTTFRFLPLVAAVVVIAAGLWVAVRSILAM